MSVKEDTQRDIIIIPCSGAEYHGELARQVAIKLSEKSKISTYSSMFCSTIFLKNVLLEKERMVEITKNDLKSKFIIVLDGCRTSCESLMLKNLGINPDLILHLNNIVPKEKVHLDDIEAYKNRPKLSEIKGEDIIKSTQHILEKLRDKGYEIEGNANTKNNENTETK